ncbi:hypothetical protein MARPO_0010s0039 [Marchantia polymorpha]|uniref:MULE transposase domain-containing protein n=1 Tax=Marchantia polymorpha TaxID=3197 RepID=A0A2R6XKM5_MARPO|nr:hypothetical protein MARPO_0010s0039 [Marchantia polymorpha]|eukprot:PTQ46629.1 hypothetical protein MARPO_0010s0039 [Marchantia polymorpha]
MNKKLLRAELKHNCVFDRCDEHRALNSSSRPAAIERISSSVKSSARGFDSQWGFTVKEDHHNHEPSIEMSGHPTSCRLSEATAQSVKQLAFAGVAPRQILSTLRAEDPSLFAISKTVYNAKAKQRFEVLAGRSPIQALLDELQGSNYRFNVECNSCGNVQRLFFAHPDSIAMAIRYSNVLLMDCTYKTNRFRMPLLVVIGRTGHNMSFFALTQLKNLFDGGHFPTVLVIDADLALENAMSAFLPECRHLFCIWHINKNVLAKRKKFIRDGEYGERFMNAWAAICRASTPTEFDTLWEKMRADFKDVPAVLDYVNKTWIPHKTKFVSAWTDDCLHLRNTTTSCVEGAHAMLKQFLQVLTGDLHAVREEIGSVLAHQHIRVPHMLRITLFANLVGRITRFALNLLDGRRQQLNGNAKLPECTGVFRKTLGLPCAHDLAKIPAGAGVLLTDVHPHWHLDNPVVSEPATMSNITHTDIFFCHLRTIEAEYLKWPPAKQAVASARIAELAIGQMPLLANPLPVQPKGRPVGAKNKTKSSTKRELSAFEHVTKRARLCGTEEHTGTKDTNTQRK